MVLGRGRIVMLFLLVSVAACEKNPDDACDAATD
jgi:hypothetical protein